MSVSPVLPCWEDNTEHQNTFATVDIRMASQTELGLAPKQWNTM